jgi:Tfp pilus assembly protein PilV
MLMRRSAALRRRLQRDEAGFSLVEVVVAMVVLMLFAASLSIVLLNGLSVSKVSRQRVAAANLAARELEIVRNKFASSTADAMAVAATNAVTNGNPLGPPGASVVDGTPYTVRRDVQWLPTGTGVSACDGGSVVNYPSLDVSVTVTWPNMRSAKPVRAETLMTPLKGTLADLSTAFVAVKVQNAAGLAAVGVTAEAKGPGGTFTHSTDDSGCAVFQVGSPGTYVVTLDMPGWVDQTGTQRSVKTAPAVTAGQLVRLSMTYDAMASMDVTLTTDGGYALPNILPAVNYIKPNVAAASARQIVAATGTTTRVTGLWPSKDGYAAWPGGCNDSDPAGLPTSGTRGAVVVLPPGGVGSVNARLAPLDLTVATRGGVPVSGAVVTATSQNCGATVPDRMLTLGTTDGSGKLKTSLPYGKWMLQTTYRFLPATATLTPASVGVTTYTFEVD